MGGGCNNGIGFRDALRFEKSHQGTVRAGWNGAWNGELKVLTVNSAALPSVRLNGAVPSLVRTRKDRCMIPTNAAAFHLYLKFDAAPSSLRGCLLGNQGGVETDPETEHPPSVMLGRLQSRAPSPGQFFAEAVK